MNDGGVIPSTFDKIISIDSSLLISFHDDDEALEYDRTYSQGYHYDYIDPQFGPFVAN